jgi:Ca-activated chloride channel family protein
VATIAWLITLVSANAAQPLRPNAAQPLRPDVRSCPDLEDGGLLLTDSRTGDCSPAPVLEADISIAVTGIIARARVTQRFRNPGDGWVEGVYVFPLPDGAAVDHLRMFVGSRVIEGQIRERGKARAEYTAAKRTGIKASLVEQQRPNVFTTRVANIGPGETVEIDIELQSVIQYDEPEFRLRFPTVVAPRYFPSTRAVDHPTPTRSPLSEIDLLGNAIPRAIVAINPLSLEVEIDSGFTLRTLYSPSHRIETEDLGGHVQLVRLHESVVPADRDFVLAWAPKIGDGPGDEPGVALFTEEIDGDTYALLMVVPALRAHTVRNRFTREVILVIDTSGSMGGASIDQAKLALLLALEQLHPGDWFNVVEFDSDARSLFSDSVEAHYDNIETARSFVDSLAADGGTHIHAALQTALEGKPAPTDLRQVVFITDGAVGNEADLFGYIEQRLGDSRLFTVGIGAAPNAHFMRKAAQFGRGTFTYIGTTQEVSSQMEMLFEKLENPAATEIVVDWSEHTPIESWPQRIPDLYAGEPLVVAARLTFPPDEILVSGRLGDTTWERSVEAVADSNGHATENGIGKLWARRKIEGLSDSLALGADREAVREQIIDVALEHHLVSRFTSLVAIDTTPSAPPGGGETRAVSLNRVAGSLPTTATPSSAHAFIAAVLLAAGLLLQPRHQEDRGPVANRIAPPEGVR